MTRPKTWILAALLTLSTASLARADIRLVDFDDLSLAPESYWRGPDPNGTIVEGPYGEVNVGKFTSHGTDFVNRSELTYGSWSGFAYSNTSDTTVGWYTNQFSAFTGTGAGPGQDNYAVAFGYDDYDANMFDPDPFDPASTVDLLGLPTLYLPDGYTAQSMLVTNTTYAALVMRDSEDGFSDGPFGPGDFFRLSIYGIDANGNALASGVDFFLADFRGLDPDIVNDPNYDPMDYIVHDWTAVDLTPLAGAVSLHFNLYSSDAGMWGMNTPGYFAMDDLTLFRAPNPAPVPEPSSLALAGLGLAIGAVVARRRVRQ
jgi:hypothetical protein